jgi:hypothetical protein
LFESTNKCHWKTEGLKVPFEIKDYTTVIRTNSFNATNLMD